MHEFVYREGELEVGVGVGGGVTVGEGEESKRGGEERKVTNRENFVHLLRVFLLLPRWSLNRLQKQFICRGLLLVAR